MHKLALTLLVAGIASGCGARTIPGGSRRSSPQSDAAVALDRGSRLDIGVLDQRAWDIQAPAAELYFASFTIALNGDERRVRYDVTICNRGPVSSRSTVFTVYNDLPRPPTRFDKISVQLPVRSLARTGCVELTVAQGPLEERRYRSWGFIDPADQVVEGDETNNIVQFREFDFSRE